MTEKSCPIPTPDESRYMTIQQAAEQSMLEKVFQAIKDATAEVASKVREAGPELEPASAGYFMFAVQQATFVRLSGGETNTLEGGDPEIGERIARNCQDIVDHDWRKDRTFTGRA